MKFHLSADNFIYRLDPLLLKYEIFFFSGVIWKKAWVEAMKFGDLKKLKGSDVCMKAK